MKQMLLIMIEVICIFLFCSFFIRAKESTAIETIRYAYSIEAETVHCPSCGNGLKVYELIKMIEETE